jgi:hypothetical protein
MTSHNLTLDLINPKISDKYSPNLFKWVKETTKAKPLFYLVENLVAYRDKHGGIYVGYTSPNSCEADKNWISGMPLGQVLGSGNLPSRWRLFAIETAGMTQLKNFWKEYSKHGRCAIDKQHARWFIGDETRWLTKGNTRSCQWCGKAKQRLVKRKEVIIHEDWVGC